MLQGQGSVIRQEQRKEGTYKERGRATLGPSELPGLLAILLLWRVWDQVGPCALPLRKLAALPSAPLCSHLL